MTLAKHLNLPEGVIFLSECENCKTTEGWIHCSPDTLITYLAQEQQHYSKAMPSSCLPVSQQQILNEVFVLRSASTLQSHMSKMTKDHSASGFSQETMIPEGIGALKFSQTCLSRCKSLARCCYYPSGSREF